MARLPVPGGDVDAWAAILNQYLLVSHNPDGTLRDRVVPLRALKTTNLPSDPPIKTPILSNDAHNLRWGTTIEINVRDYGAKGDGKTDDTAAIQAAINAAGSGLVVFPSGVFMIRGVRIRNKGAALHGDGRFGTRIKRHSGRTPLIDISGSGTGIGHQRYDTISNLQLDGNNLPGVLIRSYYADCCVYRELSFIHCPGLTNDFVEVWDTRFENCTWEHCGSLTEPAMLFRNSTERGTFGFSDDTTNQIFFVSCRWEGFGNGALRFDGKAGGSKKLLNGIFFVACKMETHLAAGPAFQVLGNTTIIFVNQLYMAIMGVDPRHQGPIDAIEDHATHIFMTNVYVQWGKATNLASSVVRVRGGAPHMYHELGAFYPTDDPVKATIWVEPAAKDVTISSLWVNRGRRGIGSFSKLLDSNPVDGLNIPLEHPGSFRITDNGTGRDMVKIDNNPVRPAFHLLHGVDTVGFSDNYASEKWRIVGRTGAARFASGKFQIEGTKGYVGLNSDPFTGIAMLIRPATVHDLGLVVIRQSKTANHPLIEFQDEDHHPQGMTIDFHGRPIAVGDPPQVTPGQQANYARPDPQVRDMAGTITVEVRPSPSSKGTIAKVVFSRPYNTTPLFITLADHSTTPGNLYVSDRTRTSFVVSTRSALPGRTILHFDYAVIA